MPPPSASGPPIVDHLAEPSTWARPDPALAAAGIEGEYVVAKVRVLAMGLLLIAPTWNILRDPHEPIYVTGFAVTLAAGIAAIMIWRLLRRGRWRPWIGFASSAFDVSMVSTALISFLVVASPMIALNSKVTFEMYFLAIVATSLRYDARICIAIGLLALGQYAGLWAYAASHYDLHDPKYVEQAGPYSAVDLFTRLILMGVATILATTIVRRARRLLYLASRDRLTGLFNRGHFDRALSAAMERSARDGQPLSLAILDIDQFKQINDIYGHVQGDRVLQQVAERLTGAMRRTDIVARYGGEEFVILMPGTLKDAALSRMETLRRDVAEQRVDVGGVEELRVNFSAGIAGIPGDAAEAKELLSRADARLLLAKRAGRGRCIATDDAGGGVVSASSGPLSAAS
ncbi:MAG: GGDEF domain-containing protein [Gemmatimonadota bacterium]